MVDTRLTLATGTAEREAALEMAAARPGNHRITLGADKVYDVAALSPICGGTTTPHVAIRPIGLQSTGEPPATPATRSVGGCAIHRGGVRLTKSAAGFRKTRHRGLACVKWMFTLTATAQPGSAAQADGRCGVAMPGSA